MVVVERGEVKVHDGSRGSLFKGGQDIIKVLEDVDGGGEERALRM